ncbi:MAG: RnfABCDGE type electron transport complex subunit G [Actinobacteria bacterium]|nr:MAG: RnfABCDGE type electron transport complex subunit G [Actinomycetota bacterium]
MIVTLTLVSVIAGGGLALTYAVTRDRIEEQRRIDEARAFSAALPAAQRPEDFSPLADALAAARRQHPEVSGVLEGRADGDLKGYVIVAAPRGYGGPVQMAVGIDTQGRVTGVAVISGNETPGLGSQALEPPFLSQFKGKTPDQPVRIGQDVDAISGATRSSVAVATGVRMALDVYSDQIRR